MDVAFLGQGGQLGRDQSKGWWLFQKRRRGATDALAVVLVFVHVESVSGTQAVKGALACNCQCLLDVVGEVSAHSLLRRVPQGIQARVAADLLCFVGAFRRFHDNVVQVERERLEDKAGSSRPTKANKSPAADFVRHHHPGRSWRWDRLAVDISAVSATAVHNIARAIGVVKEHGVSTRGSCVHELNVAIRRAPYTEGFLGG